MAGFGDEENVPPILEPVAHRHRLGAGGGFVEERGVRDVERGEIGDHRLKIQERFEAALGNFSLIRRVLRVPAGIFQNVALNHRRRDAIVIAHADERAADLVLRRDFLQRGERLMFVARGGQLQRTSESNRFGNGGVNHRVQARVAELLEHFAGIGGTRADVAADKPVGMRRVFDGLRNFILLFGKSHARKLKLRRGNASGFRAKRWQNPASFFHKISDCHSLGTPQYTA